MTHGRHFQHYFKEASALERSFAWKWIWRFAYDKDNLWKQVIMAKYGQEGHGWRTKKAYGVWSRGVEGNFEGS